MFDQADSATLNRIEELVRGKRITDPVTGQQTIYDKDTGLPKYRGDVFENVAGTVPYRGTGINRAERLDDV